MIRSYSCGFTLLELAVAVAVLVVAVMAFCGMFQETSEGLQYFTNVTASDTALQRTLDQIAEDIANAAAGDIVITPFSDYDAVTITRRWGENGTATCTYTVDGGAQLVRIAEIPGRGPSRQLMARRVDSFTEAEGKGFSVQRAGTSNLFQITLRVTMHAEGNTLLKRSFSTTARARS